MSFLGRIFGKSNSKNRTGTRQEEPRQLSDTLRENGIDVSMEELTAAYDSIAKDIEVSQVLPEALWTSDVAELVATESGYQIHVSISMPGDDDTLRAIVYLGTTYAAISELAKERKVVKFVIEPGVKVGLVGVPEHRRHPIQSLL